MPPGDGDTGPATRRLLASLDARWGCILWSFPPGGLRTHQLSPCSSCPLPCASLPPPAVARGVQKVLQDYRNLQDIIAILGMDELSEEVRGRPLPSSWQIAPTQAPVFRHIGCGS